MNKQYLEVSKYSRKWLLFWMIIHLELYYVQEHLKGLFQRTVCLIWVVEIWKNFCSLKTRGLVGIFFGWLIFVYCLLVCLFWFVSFVCYFFPSSLLQGSCCLIGFLVFWCIIILSYPIGFDVSFTFIVKYQRHCINKNYPKATSRYIFALRHMHKI